MLRAVYRRRTVVVGIKRLVRCGRGIFSLYLYRRSGGSIVRLRVVYLAVVLVCKLIGDSRETNLIQHDRLSLTRERNRVFARLEVEPEFAVVVAGRVAYIVSAPFGRFILLRTRVVAARILFKDDIAVFIVLVFVLPDFCHQKVSYLGERNVAVDSERSFYVARFRLYRVVVPLDSVKSVLGHGYLVLNSTDIRCLENILSAVKLIELFKGQSGVLVGHSRGICEACISGSLYYDRLAGISLHAGISCIVCAPCDVVKLLERFCKAVRFRIGNGNNGNVRSKKRRRAAYRHAQCKRKSKQSCEFRFFHLDPPKKMGYITIRDAHIFSLKYALI